MEAFIYNQIYAHVSYHTSSGSFYYLSHQNCDDKFGIKFKFYLSRHFQIMHVCHNLSPIPLLNFLEYEIKEKKNFFFSQDSRI